MKLLLGLFCVVAAWTKVNWANLDGYTFDNYVEDFGFKYTADELPVRKWVFEQQIEVIRKHNQCPKSTYKLNVNKFTALTPAEFSAYKGYNAAMARAKKASMPYAKVQENTTALPTSLDWRIKGMVTDVKDQGGCGSCWAFATTETVESAVAIATGKLLVLSPQQVTACTPNPDKCGGTGGCSGAIAELGFDYIHKNGGLATEADYPYTAGGGSTGKCLKKNLAATVGGFVKNKENDLDGLMAAVQLGPVAISVAADWGSYDSGVYDGCSQDATIDHAVQLVGYGVDAGVKYWLVRNSWGDAWGEKGYIRLKRFDTSDAYCGTDSDPSSGSGCAGGPSSVKICGMCGILYDTAYPTGGALVNGTGVMVADM